uniref:Uncharacterized protein n=1 Tax=Melanopsichium pennsylvanicum 4 TaxID=1398559 RepID=A0A077R996_9BASI|nr:uncharacterized protein BN887_06128 [Melanopsichium pennsylvanicum 4]
MVARKQHLERIQFTYYGTDLYEDCPESQIQNIPPQ